MIHHFCVLYVYLCRKDRENIGFYNKIFKHLLY